MVKIDSSFFDDMRVKALVAEFGPAGAYVLVKLMCRVFESPEGFWMRWDLPTRMVLAAESRMTLGEFDTMMERMGSYGLVNHERLTHGKVLTSRFFQTEFIRQCGVARASKVSWDECRDLSLDELVELGVVPAQEASEEEIPVGAVVELPDSIAPGLRALYQRQRIRNCGGGGGDRSMAYFRRVRRGDAPNKKATPTCWSAQPRDECVVV